MSLWTQELLGRETPHIGTQASPVLTDDVTGAAGLLSRRQQGLCSRLPDGPASLRVQDAEAKSPYLAVPPPSPPPPPQGASFPDVHVGTLYTQAPNSFSSRCDTACAPIGFDTACTPPVHSPAAELPTAELHVPPRGHECRQRPGNRLLRLHAYLQPGTE